MHEPKPSSRLVWLWGIVPLVVLLEIVAQWRIGDAVPTSEQWRQAAKAIRAEKTERDLVVIAPDWATHGRMYLKDLITREDFGRFDTTTYIRIYEVSVNGARSPETESLEVAKTQSFGEIEVKQYELPETAVVTYNFIDNAASGKVTNSDKPARPRIVIDHWFFPRLVIPIKLSKKGVSVIFSDVPISGSVVRGYGIVGYRSGRFNEGGPITMSIYVGDQLLGKHVVKNFGPKEPFEFHIPKGLSASDIRFEIRTDDGFDREFGIYADVRNAGKRAK